MFYIMSYNQINGFFTGAFQDLDGLFYVGRHQEDGRVWTGLISEATPFKTRKEALALMNNVWGRSFAKDTFGIVEWNGDIGERDKYARKQHDNHQAVSRLLATKHISKQQLMNLAEHPSDNGITWRERWIIEILTKEES